MVCNCKQVSYANIADAIQSNAKFDDVLKTLESVQKIISVYERAKPIIDKTVPVINNLKTTIKVARAFSGFSNSEIEKAFDQIPDSDSNESSNHIEQSSDKVAKPFYP